MQTPGQQPQSHRLARIRKMFAGDHDPELFAREFVAHTPWDLALHKGKSEARGKAFRAPQVFSDLKITVEDAKEQGDHVVVHWRMRGKWTSPLPFAPELKPTGREVNVTGINTYVFKGDQIVEKRGAIDGIGLARQMFGGGGIAAVNPQACVEAMQAVVLPPDLQQRFSPF